MQIRIYEDVDQKPNGDRDTRTHPCSTFKVVLINGGKKQVMQTFTQWDPYWTHINGTREQYLGEAMKFANDLAATLGGAEIVGVTATAHENEIIKLEARIREDQKRLQELKIKVL